MAIIYSKSMYQPGKFVNLGRGQLNRENVPGPVLARGFDLARNVRTSRPVSASSFSTHTRAESRGLLTGFLPVSATASISAAHRSNYNECHSQVAVYPDYDDGII